MLEMTSSGAPIEDQARGQNLQAFILSIHDINEFLECCQQETRPDKEEQGGKEDTQMMGIDIHHPQNMCSFGYLQLLKLYYVWIDRCCQQETRPDKEEQGGKEDTQMMGIDIHMQIYKCFGKQKLPSFLFTFFV
ncbi:hypothetical protein M9H77_20497 [Catharanthus roseus]|uniref:Uncharacterized protein n=1 Tax=Catharanthus roseus TaxID=4058 RepID=A0ACC0AKR1_CATRO|nr:hypothetical protein M9H77_20497 [Catharanthus roseus]